MRRLYEYKVHLLSKDFNTDDEIRFVWHYDMMSAMEIIDKKFRIASIKKTGNFTPDTEECVKSYNVQYKCNGLDRINESICEGYEAIEVYEDFMNYIRMKSATDPNSVEILSITEKENDNGEV